MVRDELNAELLRLLRDVGRVGAQRFLADVEHLLRKIEPETERIDGVAWPETIALSVTMPRPTISVAYAGLAEGTGTAFRATVVTGKATFDGGGVMRARGVVTRPAGSSDQVVALVVLVAVVGALLVVINTQLPPPQALVADLLLMVDLLLALQRNGDR